MNEKQRYQNAFNEIPGNYNIDLDKIRDSKKPAKMKVSGIITAMLLLLSVSFTTVYAVNEDFRSDFTMWITGRRTTAELTKIDDHHYEVLITLPDGNQVSCDAVSDPAGPPLDPDQLTEDYINLWQIEKNDQGRVIFYYQNKMTLFFEIAYTLLLT